MKPWLVHLSTETGWRGGERQVALLSAGLHARGVAQVVVAPPGSPLARAAAAAGVAVRAVPPGLVGHPLAWAQLAGDLRRRPDAILHAHTSKALDRARLLRALAPVAAVVHTRRVDFPVRCGRKYRTAAERYVAVSRAVRDRLVAAGADPLRCAVIHSAVDFAALDAVPAAVSPFAPGTPVVGCIAALTAEKGVAVLAQAWSLVATARPDARLLLIGDGPQRSVIAATLERAGLAATAHLAGFHAAATAWLPGLAVYVQPSLQEGLGSTVIDALGCGLPVVASATGGLPEVVGDDGWLVPPGDPRALASAIIAILADPAAARARASVGRARVRRDFAVAGMVEAYARLYAGLGLEI